MSNLKQHKNRIVELYESGKTLNEVGECFNVSGKTIRNFLVKHTATTIRPPKRGSKPTAIPEQEQECIALYAQGLPMRVVAEKNGRKRKFCIVYFKKKWQNSKQKYTSTYYPYS